ncbi:MAG: DUF6057 family protein [Bacteroidota bacterium]
MKRERFTRIAGYSGFFLMLIYLFYYLKEVDGSLIYYWQQTIPLSFRDSMQFPGGLSGLLGDWFLESLTQNFRGSMGVALLVLTVFLSLQLIFRQMKKNPAYFIFMLAALIPFILLFAHYTLPAGLILSITTGFLFSAIQGFYSPRKLVFRAGYNFAGGAFIYLCAGVAGLLVLLQAIIVRYVLSKKYRELLSALPLLVIPILYLPLNLASTVKYAYLGSFLLSELNALSPVLYFSLFSPLLLLVIFISLRSLFSQFTMKRTLFFSGTGIILVIVVLVFSSKASINERERDGYKIVQAGLNKDYKRVIELTSQQHSISNLEEFEFNRALYHTGQLLEKLFCYPQPWGEKGIFLEGDISCPVAVHISDFNFDLGFVNEARHWATEAQMGLMRHPIVLKHLVISYIAVGNTEAARKYLRILSRSGLYKEWGDQVREMIENNTASEDSRIQSFISNNPRVDFFCSTSNPTRKLLDFYNSNPDNKMAFEFLIASYLLQHEVGKVVPYLSKFRQFGYEKLPRAVEEAMLIYASSPKADLQLLEGYSTSQKTLGEFRGLTGLMSGSGERAEKMLNASAYRNTYWYYLLFTSPHASIK